MKQTAVEWLANEMPVIDWKVPYWKIKLEQAKEMEKEQMVDFAFKYGDLTTREIAHSFDKEYKTNNK
jgi:hypothetical protein